MSNEQYTLEELQNIIREMTAYSEELSKGNLSVEPPTVRHPLCNNLKLLQSSLSKLTYQANEAKAHLDMAEGFNELLVEMLSKRNEWLLVVDQNTREVLYCNKKSKHAKTGKDYCSTCKSQLPFHSQLISWSGPEQYNVWEIDDAKETHYRITSFPVDWKEHSSYVHIAVDITEEKQAAKNLTSKAYHDPGTGIKNRLFFEEYMDHVLQEKREAILCYLDLDGLKYVNDKFGHLEGDMYIQNFVELIKNNFRSEDTFARIGGDEFCLVLTGNIKELIERKLAEILASFQAGTFSPYQCSFSYGIVEISGSDNKLTRDELLKAADVIMYEFKRRNKQKFPDLVR